MRKTIFIFCFVIGAQFSIAQRSSQFPSSDRLYNEGKAMFDDRNYAGCMDKIYQYKKQATTQPDLLKESDYLLLASDYYLGRKDITDSLMSFWENNPTNIHRNEIAFMTASCYFSKGGYIQAIAWFKDANIDYLSESQQDDYAYRLALSYLKTGNNDDAFNWFSVLKTTGSAYRSAANYYLAYIHYTREDYNQALNLFGQLKDNTEFRPEVLYYISQINFIQKRYSQTITDGTTLLTNYPDNERNSEINRILGISYYYEGEYEKAVKYLNRYISSGNKVSSKDYYINGLAYYMQNNYAKAIENLSLSKPGNDEQGQSAYLYLGQSYLNTRDYQDALRAFESASRMDFNTQAKEAAMYNYAMLLHQTATSAFGESVTVLENFLNLYPNSIYSDKVNEVLVDVYFTTKNYDTALASIAKIKNPGAKILEAQQKIFYYLGTFAYTNNNYAEAVSYFTKTIAAGNYAVDEKNKAAYWRGESLFKRGQFAEAIKDYSAFLQTTGNNAGNLRTLSNYNIAYCYFKQNQYDKAAPYFQTYIREEDNKSNFLADAYSRLGDCYFYNRRFSEAQKAYDQAITTVPSAGDYALYQKGMVLGLQKDYKGKIAQMDNLIANYANSPYIADALNEKGHAYIMLDNNTMAIDTYNRLLMDYPNSAAARKAGLQVGLLYFNTNQLQNSATAYKTVISKYPESEEAKVAIQDLKSVYLELNDIAGYGSYVNSLNTSVKFNISEQDSLTYLAAEKLFLKNDIAQAQAGMKSYLQSFPNGAFSTNAHYYLATTYYQQNNYTEAKKEYGKVLEAGDTRFSEEAVSRTAELQYRDNEYAKALLSYQQLQKIAATKTSKDAGSLGIIRSAAKLDNHAQVITAADLLLNDATLNPEIATEARYFRAKSLLKSDKTQAAEKDLEVLAKDTRTVFGAEAKYLLAQHYFDVGHPNEAKVVVQDYIRNGTPHQYWLARSFILLSDVYAAEKDNLQARQYLESLQNNYKNTSDDIQQLINERLIKL
jgi:TolA-binding protein